MEDLLVYIVLILGLAGIYFLGIVSALPNELENGCIVHNDKLYCEEVNKVED